MRPTKVRLVPDAIFEVASDMWQPPDEDEVRDRRIQLISTADTREG